MANGFHADRGFWTQDNGDHRFLITRAARIHFLDREIPLPPAQVHHAIVRHASPDVLKFRIEREDVPLIHRRQVRNSEIGLSRAELILGSDNEHIQIEGSDTCDN